MPSVKGSNISLTVDKGELIGITGVNGSGKSTLAGYLSGMSRPEALGQVLIAGLDPYSQLDREKLRSISAVVYQDPRRGIVFEGVGRDILFGLENQGVPKDQIARKAKYFVKNYSIDKVQGRVLGTLSGGEQQRAALVSALMTGPELLILDEATSMQDRDTAAIYMDRIIKAVRTRGETMVVFSKSKDILQEMDRVYELRDGELYEIDADGMPVGSYEEKNDFVTSLPESSATGEASRVRVPGHNSIEVERYITAGTVGDSAAALQKGDKGISLHNISFGFGRTMVFDNVNARFVAGSAYRITGASGSGKTTYLKLIAGLLKPLDGDIFVSEKSKIGYVFQYPTDGFVEGTVLDDVMFGPISDGHPKSEARGMAEAVLRFVGVSESLWMRSPLKLSVGEQRLVSIAGALALSPDFLLIDEPYAGLDINYGETIRGIIEALCGEGKCIITVEG